jgi:hypothetical protein
MPMRNGLGAFEPGGDLGNSAASQGKAWAATIQTRTGLFLISNTNWIVSHRPILQGFRKHGALPAICAVNKTCISSNVVGFSITTAEANNVPYVSSVDA